MQLIRTDAYLRCDGRKGIRNSILVAYLVECAHHVAREIVWPFRDQGIQLIGFGGCYPNQYSFNMMERLCTHPNVGGVLLLSLGCEGFDRRTLERQIESTGRPVSTLVIQQCGGTTSTIAEGKRWVMRTMAKLQDTSRAEMRIEDLIVGTVCGGSDATSGITANPVIGRCFDQLISEGASAIFEETGELIGCEQMMSDRALTPSIGKALKATVEKAARYYTVMGHGSFAPGNADGGLTTQEEKSMGAYSKSGSSPISGLLKPGDIPARSGLYLLDVVPDGEVRFGFPNINDSAEIAELIACGSHIILFSTGRGSVVGSAISPVIKVCANPQTFRNLSEDMDLDAGQILEGQSTLTEMGAELFRLTLAVARGECSKSEALGHREFVLGYKTFEPLGPGCFPS
jgi:altronate hydrolase